MLHHRSALIAAGLLLASTAAAEEFTIDPVHTRVLVAVDHAGFSQALGTVSGATGEVEFTEGWAPARVNVSIPLDRLDFGDARWNAAVKGMLDTARHPEARFRADRVTPRGERAAEACGELQLHGVTRPLCLDITFNQLRRHPLPPFRRTIGFSATGRLSRAAFGVDRWASMVGDDVELRIELEASRGLGTPRAPVGTTAGDGS